jgi:uncharacterized membrane protein
VQATTGCKYHHRSDLHPGGGRIRNGRASQSADRRMATNVSRPKGKMIAKPPESGRSPSPVGHLSRPSLLVDPVDATSVADSTRANGVVLRNDTVERCAWSLVWLGVITGGVGLWGSWSSWSLAGVAAPLVVMAGIVGLAAAWTVTDPLSPAMQLTALGAAVASTLGNQAVGIHVRQFYSTDSGAFNQVAARFLLHGTDPYVASMGSASQLLKVPAENWTYTVTGSFVTHVSYPAGSFLLQVPALALGFRHQVVDWMDLYAWILAGVLVFVLIPVSVRWLAALLILTPVFADIFGSGGTDAVFLPFLILAVWRWDRFGLDRSAGVARWMGPIALGLACSVKQTPWFCLPFLALGLVIEARNSGRRPLPLVLRYVAVVVVVFTAVNLPFIVWQPAAWARGTFLPFTEPLVADGQGLVTLALHGVAHGVSLPLLTAAGILVLVALLAGLVLWYPRMKRVWMLLLPLTFFVATRSLSTYLLDLYPAAIVAALSVSPAAGPAVSLAGRRKLPLALAAIGPALAAVAVSVLAFLSPPLQIAVRSVSASHAATSLDAVTVTVHNRTGGTVVPHFMVDVDDAHPDGFWYPAPRRPFELGPHASATVTLRPTTYAGAPTHGSRWLVEAYTSSPEALSTSPIQIWRLGKVR